MRNSYLIRLAGTPLATGASMKLKAVDVEEPFALLTGGAHESLLSKEKAENSAKTTGSSRCSNQYERRAIIDQSIQRR